ncbi:MAG TPA: hypothetical protein VKY92_02090 [Verrucomicrobiae bacterium]|nr:hypothetical protein [Verrucomicrobiae bacterium]
MEIINVKVPNGTKGKLRKVYPNLSALIREQIEHLLEHKASGPPSMYNRTAHLCGVIKGGPRNMGSSREYLKQYAKKRAH